MRVGSLEQDPDPLQWRDNSFGLQYSSISNLLLVAYIVRLTAQPATPPANPFRKAKSKVRLSSFDFAVR
jgi:hypothetical protein